MRDGVIAAAISFSMLAVFIVLGILFWEPEEKYNVTDILTDIDDAAVFNAINEVFFHEIKWCKDLEELALARMETVRRVGYAEFFHDYMEEDIERTVGDKERFGDIMEVYAVDSDLGTPGHWRDPMKLAKGWQYSPSHSVIIAKSSFAAVRCDNVACIMVLSTACPTVGEPNNVEFEPIVRTPEDIERHRLALTSLEDIASEMARTNLQRIMRVRIIIGNETQ